MKVKLYAYVTIFITIAAVIANTAYLNLVITDFHKEISLLDTSSETAAESAKSIRSRFEKAENYISLTVSHDDLTNIEECFAELVGALKIGDSDEAEILKNRLLNSLEHLRRLSGFNIDAII